MSRLILITTFLMCVLNLHAQIPISGTVNDEHGNPLPGASVYLQKSLQGTITASDGSFSILKTKTTPDSLIITFMGYQTEAYLIDSTSGSTEQAFQTNMKLKPFLADDVMVFGSRAGSTTPIAYSNLTKEDLIRANTGNDITYMLSLTPSVVTTTETGIGVGYTSMRIRGTDPTRINVTIDGIPLNDSESQGVYWVNMPDFGSSVDNVQIQRGVGTSTQGAAAFGATVNFQTGDLKTKPYGEYQLLGGSFGTLRHTLKAGTGLLADHFTFDARVSKLNSDGYVDYAFSDHQSMYLSGAYHARNTLIRASVLHGDQITGISWWGVPAEVIDTARTYNPAGVFFDRNGEESYYENQTDNYKQTHYQLQAAHKLSDRVKLNAALHYTRGAGYYEQFQDDDNWYHTTELSAYGLEPVIEGPDTITASDLARQKWMDNHFYGFTASALYKAARVEVTGGLGWNQYLGDHFGEIIWMERVPDLYTNHRWYFNEGDKTDWNVFAKANYLLNKKINVFGDLQFRHINYVISGADDDLFVMDQEHNYNFMNPKAGVFYNHSSNQKAWASFAIAHREPTRANFKEAKGDPASTPKRERLYDLELGYQYTMDILSLAANLYNMQYQDQLIPTGEKSNVGYDIMTNVEKSFRRGIEVEAIFVPDEHLKWTVNFTLSSNKIIDYVEYASHYDSEWNEEIIGTPLGKTNISYSPSLLWNSQLEYKLFTNAYITLISRYVGKQYFDNTSSEDRKIDPYFTNDLKLEYSFDYAFLKNVRLMMLVNNIFNVKYINNGYGGNWYESGEELTWAYYYPSAGIHAFAGITVSF